MSTMASRTAAEATYRRIDVAGRTALSDGPALVQLLYEELCHALRAAGHAAEARRFVQKSERVTRATAILYALEANLDHEAGGELSATLSRLYAGARRRVVAASLDHDPAPFRAVADQMDEIAGAWRQARAA